MRIEVDDTVPFVPLVHALNSVGLTLSNVPGPDFTFRLHFLSDQVIDGQMRSGMKHLFRTLQRGGPQLRVVPTDPPGAA